MLVKVNSLSNLGLKVNKIEIEIDISPSLPMIVVVGLPDKAVQESKERLRSSFKNTGIEFPLAKVTVNLAPANIHKTGSGFDLPIAVGLLKHIGVIKVIIPSNSAFIGELALDGNLRKVNGVLTKVKWAKENGFKEIFIPYENSTEATLITGIKIFPIKNLRELINHLNNQKTIPHLQNFDYKLLNTKNTRNELYLNDMAYIKGQQIAKKGLEIAASGGHNILFIGEPGSGKTLLARSYETILPRMTEKEILESTQIYSLIGGLPPGGIIFQRPFRSPHHSASHVSIVGGGAKLKPGEITLAHRGVLFLDEFPEFTRETLEVLRQPLEDGFVTITRASGCVKYPSKFILLAAANPTPSGYYNDNNPNKINSLNKYQAKFSGPIMDRIDIQVSVSQPTNKDLDNSKLEEKSVDIAARVQAARDIQTERYQNSNIQTNSELTLPLIKEFCKLNPKAKEIMNKAMQKYKLSARGYMRILKLSRTIADLDNSIDIETRHIITSLQFRGTFKR